MRLLIDIGRNDSVAKNATLARRATCALVLALMQVTAPIAAAQGLPPIETEFGADTTLRFSGQINIGALYYDDGEKSNTFAPVDNDNYPSLLRLEFFRDLGDWDMEVILEGQYQPRASGDVSQLDDSWDWGLNTSDVRKIDASFENERYGKFWIGQGNMASEFVAETDLSGTWIVAYSSVADPAGGQFFRFEDGALSDLTLGQAFTDYDGWGRKVRVRYDTPSLEGFQFRTSYGQDLLAGSDEGLYDLVAVYGGEFPAVELQASVGYAWDDGDNPDTLSGSISALHVSGVSLTLASGAQQDEGSGRYGYVKLGYERDFFEIGSTAFSVDYYGGTDIAAEGSQSTSYGVAAVQRIDSSNVELWLVWRSYAYDDDSAEYQDGSAVFGGARWQF